jgi:hypothetical protein
MESFGGNCWREFPSKAPLSRVGGGSKKPLEQALKEEAPVSGVGVRKSVQTVLLLLSCKQAESIE